MLFNSIDFAIFLPVVFLLYWFVTNKNLKLQNFLIIAASYFFYGWWDWRFLSLILFSTLVDYIVGLGLAREENQIKRKLLLWISIGINLGLLGFFKYKNFFIGNFKTAFSFLGTDINYDTLSIILPVGISFYTFQSLSYTIDVYKRKLEPTRDLFAFSAFICFFPQLVAGPIERATNLLPQFLSKRTFSYNRAIDGLRQILWGLFKKIVIADQCGKIANLIFDNSDFYSGSTLILGAIFFSFQLYGDFSGYSDIAIGTSRLFGFNLKKNFAFPYFSRDIAEFWRRWHISLTSWFKDYVYTPLGGSKGGTWMKFRNILIVFLLSGFWHGANWTYIVWGALNALFILPVFLMKKNRKHLDTVAKGKYLPSMTEVLNITFTFCLFTASLIVFRAEDMGHAWQYFARIYSSSIIATPEIIPIKESALIVGFMIIEWLGREQEYGIAHLNSFIPKPIRWIFYYALFIMIIVYAEKPTQFIYFQF